MSIEAINTKETFMQSVVQDKSDSVVVVVFTDDSEASTTLISMVEKASAKAAGQAVKFYKIEMSLVAAAATKLGVETAPVTVIWKGGVKAKTMTGTYGGPELKAAIDELKAQ